MLGWFNLPDVSIIAKGYGSVFYYQLSPARMRVRDIQHVGTSQYYGNSYKEIIGGRLLENMYGLKENRIRFEKLCEETADNLTALSKKLHLWYDEGDDIVVGRHRDVVFDWDDC